MDNLPYELVCNIVQNLNLRDAENLYLSLENRVMRNGIISALKERMDICRFLCGLTSNPQELLNIMKNYDCALIGERVLPFFFPDLNLSDNHWKIACTSKDCKNFMEESKSIGKHRV